MATCTLLHSVSDISALSSSSSQSAPCDASGTQACDWTRVLCDKTQLEALEFEVPVGDVRHTPLVVKVTLFCTVVALLSLAFRMRAHGFMHEKQD